MRLNLGCSSDLRGPDWLNVDLVKPAYCTSGVGDAEFFPADLSLPWPWPDSSVDEIYAADIFEHIGDCRHTGKQICSACYRPRRGEASGCQICGMMPCYESNPHCQIRHWSGRIHVMNESWRVLKPGGILRMECPDAAKGAGQWQDPTHVQPWTPNGIQYFQDGSQAWKRFHDAYGILARFKVHSITEQSYTEMAGSCRCEVYKFAAVLEAMKP